MDQSFLSLGGEYIIIHILCIILRVVLRRVCTPYYIRNSTTHIICHTYYYILVLAICATFTNIPYRDY